MLTKKAPSKIENGSQKSAVNPQSSKHHPATPSKSLATASPAYSLSSSGAKTRLVVHYDAGFPNSLYIRGCGAGLSWEKGQLLKNIKADEWIWESHESFSECEFKIVFNDTLYETGENRKLKLGALLEITPVFQ